MDVRDFLTDAEQARRSPPGSDRHVALLRAVVDRCNGDLREDFDDECLTEERRRIGSWADLGRPRRGASGARARGGQRKRAPGGATARRCRRRAAPPVRPDYPGAPAGPVSIRTI